MRWWIGMWTTRWESFAGWGREKNLLDQCSWPRRAALLKTCIATGSSSIACFAKPKSELIVLLRSSTNDWQKSLGLQSWHRESRSWNAMCTLSWISIKDDLVCWLKRCWIRNGTWNGTATAVMWLDKNQRCRNLNHKCNYLSSSRSKVSGLHQKDLLFLVWWKAFSNYVGIDSQYPRWLGMRDKYSVSWV